MTNLSHLQCSAISAEIASPIAKPCYICCLCLCCVRQYRGAAGWIWLKGMPAAAMLFPDLKPLGGPTQLHCSLTYS